MSGEKPKNSLSEEISWNSGYNRKIGIPVHCKERGRREWKLIGQTFKKSELKSSGQGVMRMTKRRRVLERR